MKRFLLKAGIVASALAPIASFAQVTYNSQLATTTTLMTAIGNDVMSTVIVVIGIVLGIVVFLSLVGYGWRQLQKRVTGRKF